MICRSWPRLRLFTESCLCLSGWEMSRGADVEEELSVSNSRASSSNESRLPDRLGTSVQEYRPSELLEEIEIAGVVALASDTGSQQKVSLFHNLQLRFSNLRPSSNEPAHLEKTTLELVRTLGPMPVICSPVHMLKRFSTFRVSTLWMRPASTVKTGVVNREGIVSDLLERASCYKCEDTTAARCSRLTRRAIWRKRWRSRRPV